MRQEGPSFYYRETITLPIRAKLHRELKGEKVNPQGFPIRSDFAFNLVVGTEFPREYKALTQDLPLRLIRVSGSHGRSFEVITKLGEREVRNILWEDEYGNYFNSLSTKGNDLQAPHAFKSSVTPSGFMYWGLQDSDSAIRVLRASEVLRKRGVDTEIITRLIEPTEFPTDGKLVPINEFKARLLHKVWKENAAPETHVSDEITKVTRAEIPALSKHLKETAFFISNRSTLVSERLIDFKNASSKKDFQDLVGEVFEAINTVKDLRSGKRKYARGELLSVVPFDGKTRKEVREPKSFNYKNPDHINYYFTTFLPGRLVRNLTKFHEAGLLHKYLHLGNITGVGGIVDLDSVVGKPLGLGDEKVDPIDQAKEAGYVFARYYDLLLNLADRGFVHLDLERVGEKKDKVVSVDAEAVRMALFYNYANMRKESKLETLMVAIKTCPLKDSFKPGITDFYQTLFEFLMIQIYKEIGFSYSLNLTSREFLGHFTDEKNIVNMKSLVENSGEYLMQLVEEDLDKRYSGKLQRVAKKYGEGRAQALRELFIEQENLRFVTIPLLNYHKKMERK